MQTACRTCRRRRLACDRTKPSCARCDADGRACGGYVRQDQPLFVNFDSSNIKRRKKRVLSEAITAQNQQELQLDSPMDRNDALCFKSSRPSLYGILALDFSPAQFADHFAMVWNYFTTVFNRTTDAWALAYDRLVLQSRALDLSLIALSLQRMAMGEHDARIAHVAHRTYGEALSAVRTLLQNIQEHNTTYRAADLALAAATCLALGLLDGSRHSLLTIFPSGWVRANPHLAGARELLQRAGPEAFTKDGLHLVFKKLREMELLNALCNYRHSCLTEHSWLTRPWKLHSKTWRDKLWDLGCNVTHLAIDEAGLDASVCVAISSAGSLPSFAVDGVEQSADDFSLHTLCVTQVEDVDQQQQAAMSSLDLERGKSSVEALIEALRQWHAAWARSPQSPLSTPDAPSTIFLSTEYRSFLLILHLVDFRVRHLLGEYADGTDSQAFSCALGLAAAIRLALKNPCFMLYAERASKPGLTEGQCRSLMPLWSLQLADAMLDTSMSDFEPAQNASSMVSPTLFDTLLPV